MSGPDCIRCRYFRPHAANNLSAGGQCRRTSPTPFLVGTNNLGQPLFVAAWPPVGKGDYCGEFMPPVSLGPLNLTKEQIVSVPIEGKIS